MSMLFPAHNIPTMSSREIAELTGKQHKDVIRDIRVMLDALQKDGADLRHVREDKDARGYTTAFHLNQELTYTLVTGYSIPMRHAVIKRWEALETGKAKPAMVPTKPASNPMLPETCNAIVAAVGAGVMPKKDGAELIRAITLASFHGSDVLFAASKRPTIERAATPAPQIQLALPNGKTPVALSSKDAERAKDAKSMTNLLKEHGYTHLSAQNAYLALAKAGMVLRGFKDGGSKGEPYWIIVGDGLLYGQNVARENKTAPYWYDSTFALLATLSGFPTMNLDAARKKGLA